MADYAISNVPRRVVYAPSGVGPYAFTFEILDQTDIAVYKGSTLLTLTTDYTVSINVDGTGTVTLVATAGTSNITIVGAKNIQRTSDFTTGGDLFADTLNDELDNQTIFIQQVAETAERGLKAPVTDPTDIAMTLPDKNGRKGKVLAFDSTTGNPVAGPALDSVVTVIEQSDNINTVADNIASVNTVAGNTSNINTVAGASSSVTTVAGSISNVNTVASDLNEPTSEINTVAVNIDNVNEVGNYILNVNAVAANTSNINSVAGNSTNINAVAGNSTNINAVATNSTNINTVATNIANVNTVATNIANVNQVAADTVVINSASANATAAAASALAASGSATSASASAAAASAVALGNEPVRHSVRPSLLLDFANTKTLDPRITFTRASTGTFYDGRTVAKAEENLFLNSQDFTTTWVTNASSVTANTSVAPDGTTTAETLTANGTSNIHYVRQTQVATSTGKTISVYAKAGTNNFLQIYFDADAAPWANFDLSGGTVGSTGSNQTASIVSVGSGWYRCILVTSSTTATNPNFNIITNGTSARAETNSLATTVLLWGAQAEHRQAVTAYTATTTAPITNYIPALQTAAANVARFEHNPVTGESLGLEIEEQRTNVLTYSEDLSNAAWTKDECTISSNAVIAPNGTQVADIIVPSTNNVASHRARFTTSSAAGAYTYSIYARANGYNWFKIRTETFYANFNLSTGVAGVTNVTSTITPVGNGWYRCTMTCTTAASNFLVYAYVANSNNAGLDTDSFAGDGFNGIAVWGAQLEAGAFATSYIPTVASQVTRSADSASMTGTNFSSWYRADEGAVYSEAAYSGGSDKNSNNRVIYGIDDGSANNRMIAYNASASASRILVSVGGTAIVNLVSNITNTSANTKTAFVYKSADYAGYTNASNFSSSTATQVPVVNRLIIGAASTGGTFSGTFSKFAFYPRRLTNAELQGLTTV